VTPLELTPAEVVAASAAGVLAGLMLLLITRKTWLPLYYGGCSSACSPSCT
jgi:hypothetical protein